jgi:hypothetical protein
MAKPIRISPDAGRQLILSVLYSTEHVAKIKTLDDPCRHHQKEKNWTVSQGAESATARRSMAH